MARIQTHTDWFNTPSSIACQVKGILTARRGREMGQGPIHPKVYFKIAFDVHFNPISLC